jgi:DNA-binding transcriptional MerR regulator
MADEKTEKETLFRISEVAKLASVTKQTVQYYLMLELIMETSRSTGGHRLFDLQVVKRVKLIHKHNISGYTLSEIRETFLHRPQDRRNPNVPPAENKSNQ